MVYRNLYDFEKQISYDVDLKQSGAVVTLATTESYIYYFKTAANLSAENAGQVFRRLKFDVKSQKIVVDEPWIFRDTGGNEIIVRFNSIRVEYIEGRAYFFLKDPSKTQGMNDVSLAVFMCDDSPGLDSCKIVHRLMLEKHVHAPFRLMPLGNE